MAEWSIAPVLKTDVLRGTGGSNPSLSAEKSSTEKLETFFVSIFAEPRVGQSVGEPQVIFQIVHKSEHTVRFRTFLFLLMILIVSKLRFWHDFCRV